MMDLLLSLFPLLWISALVLNLGTKQLSPSPRRKYDTLLGKSNVSSSMAYVLVVHVCLSFCEYLYGYKNRLK
jgi:hypothetical protein